MGKLRVAFFNADNGKVTEEFINTKNGIKDYYRLLGCDCFDVVYIMRGVDAYIDEEGLLYNNPKINMVMTERGMIPLAGNIVFTGGIDSNGNTLPLNKELDLIKKLIIKG